MTTNGRVGLSWPLLAAAAVLMMAVGAVGTYLWLVAKGSAFTARSEASAGSHVSATAGRERETGSPSEPSTQTTLPDVAVVLDKAAVERAGIVVETVTAGEVVDTLRVPGIVEANAYKQVVVTPLVTGRVTRVLAELGQVVQKDQALVHVFSPDLADAQVRFLSARASLGAHELELARTEKLADIGAASRQELERLHAEHTAERAMVEGTRSRLVLLGLSADAIEGLTPSSAQDATVVVVAPMAGAVTERTVNVGANVDPAVALLTVTDLSEVWVIVSLYERDFSRVRLGSRARITTHAYPDRALEGRVSYIDPRVSDDTRTAKVRIQVSNPRGELKLGMFAEAAISDAAGAAVATIPRRAVQAVGDRTVVYLASPNDTATFVEREVRLGVAADDRVVVLAGVDVGDRVVSEGSFAIRAERERLGLRGRAVGSAADPASTPSARASVGGANRQEFAIAVTDSRFTPSHIELRAGVPARLVFTRTSESTCATAVVFASLNIRRELPLNQPVTVDFLPERPGEIGFACGLDMLKGTLVVRPAGGPDE